MIRLLATVLGVLFIVTFVWYCYYQAIYQVVANMDQYVPENNTAVATVKLLLENIWNWFPAIMVILLIIYAVVYAQREEARSKIEAYY